jgi:dihydrofolate reductase
MARLVVHEFVSIDGFAADARGRFEFYTGGSAEIDVDTQAHLRSASAILLGATTYRLFIQYWPTPASEGELLADRINELPKYVASTRLGEAPWGSHRPATVIDDAALHVPRLKEELDGDIVVWGSLRLCAGLFAAGLVDCVRLVVVPTVLGAGRGVFPSDSARDDLELMRTGAFDGGLALLEYGVG